MEHAIAQLCAALDVTRSGWQQAGPSARPIADTTLRTGIRKIHAEHPQRNGVPRIRRELHQRGQRHGPKRIARLMRAEGLRGRCARRYGPRTRTASTTSPSLPIAWPNIRGRRIPTNSGSAT